MVILIATASCDRRIRERTAEDCGRSSPEPDIDADRRAARKRVMALLGRVVDAYDGLVPLLDEFSELDALSDDFPIIRGWLDRVNGVLGLIDEQLHHDANLGELDRPLSPLGLRLAREAADAARRET